MSKTVSRSRSLTATRFALRFTRNDRDVWYWLIPFAAGRCSLGVVAEPSFLARYQGTERERLQALVGEDRPCPFCSKMPVGTPRRDRSSATRPMSNRYGVRGFALLGNAGEFLDPIFSSGVTIAFKSASLAAAVLQRHFAGEMVDWQSEFAMPLKRGVDTFRAFVESWYRGGFQRIVFHRRQPRGNSAHDLGDPGGLCLGPNQSLCARTERRLAALEELCS